MRQSHTIYGSVLILITVSFLAGCGLRPAAPVSEAGREPEPSAGVGGYSIQIGLYETQEEAEQIAGQLAAATGRTAIIVYKPPFYRVHIDTDGDAKNVDKIVDSLRDQGYDQARRVFRYEQK